MLPEEISSPFMAHDLFFFVRGKQYVESQVERPQEK